MVCSSQPTFRTYGVEGRQKRTKGRTSVLSDHSKYELALESHEFSGPQTIVNPNYQQPGEGHLPAPYTCVLRFVE